MANKQPASGISCRRVTTIPEFVEAIRIRVDVFIIEQHCPPGWEPDPEDRNADHFIALVDDVVVATARLRRDRPGSRKIERMAVRGKNRGCGVGAELTKHVIQSVRDDGCHRLWLQAQVQASGFYQRLGFRAISGEYDFHGLNIPHTTMEYHPLKA
ncbi:GNAT family N-acetyltransferase [Actinomycetospora sp. CA-101289]|uniref:GNAT family N-acetyltransferase n=1 Tax=Actinomycetospora sp. CA-101289 TaxID=3239893 RepID=UPI003D98DBF0